MKKTIKISVHDYDTGGFKRVKWKGHIVAGTDKTMAVTRTAIGLDKLREGDMYVPTHVPTGYTVSKLATFSFREAIKNARRLHALLLEYKMPVKDPQMVKHFTPELKAEGGRRFANG